MTINFSSEFNSALSRAYEKITQARRVLVVGHRNPDGDALSSAAALLVFLEELGHDVFAYCADKTEGGFGFLPRQDKIKNYFPDNSSPSDFDLIVVVDCGSLSRTALSDEIKTAKQKGSFVIEFDHHPRVDDYSDIEIRLDDKASTTEILYYFFKHNRWPISRDLANCLLTGMLTDTANFLYSSTSGKTIDIASELLAAGAQFPKIVQGTWQNKNLVSMKLWGLALGHLKINSRYNLALTVITKDDLASLNLGEERDEIASDIFSEIAGFLSGLSGVKAVLTLREQEGDVIKGNLRTVRDDVNVSLLAQRLGGGGHAKASGFMMKGRIEKTDSGWEVF